MRGFFPLASGSKGNCLYVGTDETKLLIDAGIGIRRIESSLKAIDVSLDQIDAILITHEHADHIRSVESISAKYAIPIFANGETAKGMCEILKVPPKFVIFSTGETFEFGDLTIHPFSIPHDTLEPVGFTFEFNQMKLGVCADLGFATALVKAKLKDCDYLYLEANHDPELVYASKRPNIYKQRVLSRQGHLSNEACADLLKAIAHTDLKRVYLAHLSSECNRIELALASAQQALDTAGVSSELMIAHQDTASDFLPW